MRFKLFLFTGLFLLFSNKVISQNILSVGEVSVNAETAFDLAIGLDNTNTIAAVQFDINFNANTFDLLTGHLLTSRDPNHTLSVSSPSQGLIRVILYSTDNTAITGSTGDLLILKLKSKTLPGNFSISLTNIVMSDPSGTSLDATSQDGTATVSAPQMNIVTTQVDYGRVPIGANPTKTVTIQNLGNLPLVLSSVNTITPFSIQESFPITINANSSSNLTVLVNSTAKYNDSVVMSFQNNDPDPLRKIQDVTVKAVVYAVNEIKVGTGAGEINTEVEIPIVIENMEPFTGFQFDITLPTGFDYVENSIVQSTRFNGHTISASLMAGNVVRFISYSSSNTDFNGNSGEVFSFKLKPSVSSGNYSLVISNALISNLTLGNILSDAYNGSIQVNAPNLVISPSSISYGNVPITETRTTTVRLSNTGNAILTIDQLTFTSNDIAWDIQLPLEIGIGSFKDVVLTFTPSSSGNFSESVSFRHNGATEQNLFPIQATVFSPNYLMVKNQEVLRNTTTPLEVLLKNNDPVKAVQFDLELPAGFDLDVSNVSTTIRTTGFTVSASKLTATTYRIIEYSASNTSLSIGDSSIVSIPILVDTSVNLGAYQFNITNVIISDSNNQNISSIPLESGTVNIVVTLAVNENVISNITIYPNPTKDFIKLNNLNSLVINNMSLYNSIGSLVKQFKSNLTELNIKSLPSGLYYLKLDTDKGFMMKKIIKE